MALSQKDTERLITELHKSNRDYLIKSLNLSQEESELLLNAWRIYAKEHPEVRKRLPFQCLDSFIHGYLAHADFTRAKDGLSKL